MNIVNPIVARIVNVCNNVFTKSKRSKEISNRASNTKENMPNQKKSTVVIKNEHNVTETSKSNSPYIIVTKTVIRSEGTFKMPVHEVSHVIDREITPIISKKSLSNSAVEPVPVEVRKPASVDVRENVPLKHQYSTESHYMADSGLSLNDIDEITEKFKQYSTENGKLNKDEFILLYNQVRFEDPERLKKISEIVYKAFDIDDVNILIFFL